MRDRWVALLAAAALSGGSLLASCARPELDAECEAFGARVEECTGSAPADLAAYCAANAETIAALAAASCGALDRGVGMADGFFGAKEQGEACTFNFECSGDLVCRDVFDGLPPASEQSLPATVCFPRASHEDESYWHRLCDGLGDGDCVEGDVCFEGGTCESESLGQECSCPDDEGSCEGEGDQGGGCGPDLACVEGLCMRECADDMECPFEHDCDSAYASIGDAALGETVLSYPALGGRTFCVPDFSE